MPIILELKREKTAGNQAMNFKIWKIKWEEKSVTQQLKK